jgi:uncharacterized protein YkwD/tetratricopeptide (TPR) repeat protein
MCTIKCNNKDRKALKNTYILIGILGILAFGGCSFQEKFFSLEEKEIEESVIVSEERKDKGNKNQFDVEYSNILANKGVQMFESKQYLDAQKILTKAVEENPKNRKAKEMLRAVNNTLNRENGVYDVQYSTVLTSRGVALLEEGNYKEAEKIFEKALVENPNNVIAQHKRKEIEGKIKVLAKNKGQEGGKKKGASDDSLFLSVFGDDSNKEEYDETEDKLIEGEERMYIAYQKNVSGGGVHNISEYEEEGSKCSFVREQHSFLPKVFSSEIELSQEYSQYFRVGEVFMLSGTVSSSVKEIFATLRLKGRDGLEHQSTFKGMFIDGKYFSIPIYFQESGEFFLSIHFGKGGKMKAFPITVEEEECRFTSEEESSSQKMFRTDVQGGRAVFSWDKSENTLFRFQFVQEQKEITFYTHGSLHFFPPLSSFRDFSEGPIKVKFWGARSKNNSLQRTSEWVFGGEKDITATLHISRQENRLKNTKLTDTFSLGDKIVLEGETDISLTPEMFIIDGDGNIITKSLRVDGEKYFGEFTPDKLHTYIFEIVRDDKIGLFVGATTPQGSLPLLPDFFDMNMNESPETLSISDMPNNMLTYVNIERENQGVSFLRRDEKLEKLAQFRADDMCKRKYMGHTDPEGKTAGDYAKNFSIEVTIGENISRSLSVQSAHESLMRSAIHRRLIMKKEFNTVGFGFCWDSNKKTLLTTVQIFGQMP